MSLHILPLELSRCPEWLGQCQVLSWVPRASWRTRTYLRGTCIRTWTYKGSTKAIYILDRSTRRTRTGIEGSLGTSRKSYSSRRIHGIRKILTSSQNRWSCTACYLIVCDKIELFEDEQMVLMLQLWMILEKQIQTIHQARGLRNFRRWQTDDVHKFTIEIHHFLRSF